MLKYTAISLILLLILFTGFAKFLQKDQTKIENNQTILSKTDNAFYTTALINGVEALAVIDTGATTVAMSEQTANALGLDYKNGIIMKSETANGVAESKMIRLRSVKVGNIERENVKAVILKSDMKVVLIGMSFLGKLNIKINHDKLILSETL